VLELFNEGCHGVTTMSRIWPTHSGISGRTCVVLFVRPTAAYGSDRDIILDVTLSWLWNRGTDEGGNAMLIAIIAPQLQR
jgi:hypothetical protein